MKIAINSCYGGFSISHEAVMRYAELSGIKLFPYVNDFSKKDLDLNKVIEYKGGGAFTIIYSTKKLEPKDDINNSFFSPRDIDRDDPILIKVIEELGENADGACASLKIVEIPDDVEYFIDDYDGAETIHEKHRSWS